MTQSSNRSQPLGLASWSVLLKNSQLLIFPAIGTTILVLVVMALVYQTGHSSILLFSPRGDIQVNWLNAAITLIVALLIYWLVAKIVTAYVSGAIVGGALAVGAGHTDAFASGLRASLGRFGGVFLFALLSMVAALFTRNGRAGRRQFGRQFALGGRLSPGELWGAVSYLVLPVMIAERKGIVGALGRSAELFTQTWGQNMLGRIGLGITSCALRLVSIAPGALILVLGAGARSVPLLELGFVVLAGGLIGVEMLNTAISAIFQASLYSYAVHGTDDEILDAALIAGAFRAR